MKSAPHPLAFVLITAALMTSVIAQAQPQDYRISLVEGSAVPAYETAYSLTTPQEIKQTLDRIRDHAVTRSSFRVFDNATGREIERPDMNKIVPTAVIARTLRRVEPLGLHQRRRSLGLLAHQ